jgi:hypothetical protein
MDDMISKNIQYFFGKITNYTETMINVFHNIIGEFSVFNLEPLEGNPYELENKLRCISRCYFAISFFWEVQ